MTLLSFDFFFLFWFSVLGACVGSFLNVVIFRIPRGYKIGLPSRSICTRCRRRIRWYENIPVLSYLALRGRCHGCGAGISRRYPFVECVTALLFAGVYAHFGVTLATLYYCGFVAALVAVTFIDIDFRIIPDVISIPGVVIGLAGSLSVGRVSFSDAATGALFGGGFFWALGWAYEKYSGREGLGFGDVKLIAMIGAFLGLKGSMVTIVLSSLIGSIFGVAIMIIQRKNLKLAIPYGPFLALGALLYLFWGDSISLRLYPQFYE
ncbi:MAG: A24 family peptidase [Bdellovibrionota bacterium]